METEVESQSLKYARRLLSAGKLDEAESACREVLAKNPRSAEALAVLARVSQLGGRLEMAIQLFKKALKIDPSRQDVLDELEELLYASGRHQEAIDVWKSRIAFNPGDFHAHRNLGMCYLALGMLPDAAACFSKALEVQPDNAPLYQRLGLALQGLNRLPEAADAFRKAITLEPREPSLHISLAQTLVQLNDSEGAVYAFKRASELEPDSTRGHLQLAQALIEDGNLLEAEAQLKKILSIDPRSLNAYVLLGGVLQQLGQFDESGEVLKKAIELDPRHVPAYYFYTQCKKIDESDSALVEALSGLEKERDLSPFDRRRLFYALGKAYDDTGLYEKAMPYFEKANAMGLVELAQLGRSLNPEKYIKAYDFMIEHFTKDFFEEFEILGALDELPLLVVGMMRSGTTLVEQILSRHPQIGAGGELRFWTQRAPNLNQMAAMPRREKLAEVADAYHELLRSITPGKKRVTDKMPHNFMYLGPIHLIFPKARIIHCKRNPIDTCLSIFTTPMRDSPDYGHSRKNIVFAYRQYERLMAHWKEVLPHERFMEVQYEELVAEPERITRQMIEFAALPWNSACLKQDKADKVVRTPSMWQARQPLYKTSIERWRRYEPWLGEFAELK